MNSGRPTRAETTAAIVASAAETGASLCIPGARDVRPGRPGRRPAVTIEPAAPAERQPIAPADSQRLEYAREGGGAPSERRLLTGAGWLGRLRRLIGA